MLPQKRRFSSHTTPVTDGEEVKRLRSVLDEAADEFTCAITFELPLDPVTAEDGKVYERSAIEEWLKKHNKSPVTNENMGNKLFPALQVKNTIEKLVRSGAITGDKAESWQEKIKQQDELQALRNAAENGDAKALRKLMLTFAEGRLGVTIDYAQAAVWAQRGAEVGNTMCMRWLAFFLMKGKGVAKNVCAAVYWATAGAEAGDRDCCEWLGVAFMPAATLTPFLLDKKLCTNVFRTAANFPESAALATKWLRKAPERKGSLEFRAKIAAELGGWLRDHATDGSSSGGTA